MARGGQDTPQSSMNLLLGTLLLLLVLPGEWWVRGTWAPLAWGARGLGGYVFPWDGVDPKTVVGFHPETWLGQKGRSPLGCAEVSGVGGEGWLLRAILKPWTSSLESLLPATLGSWMR